MCGIRTCLLLSTEIEITKRIPTTDGVENSMLQAGVGSPGMRYNTVEFFPRLSVLSDAGSSESHRAAKDDYCGEHHGQLRLPRSCSRSQ